eukprot:g16016.t1
MTLSAGTAFVVVGCCTLLLGGTSHAFVTPVTPARNEHLAPSSRFEGTSSTAATRLRATTTTGAQHSAAARGRRKRSRMPNRLPPGGSAGASPLLMSSTVDAELAEPPSGGDGGGGGGGDVVSETGDPATRAALKQKLLRKVATLNRGFLAQEDDRLDVEEIVEMLELENPNPKPCEAFESGSSPLAGRWQLLYTTSLDVLSLQVNPTVTVGKIFQEIEPDGKAIQNIIELQPPFAAVNKILGSSMATLTVKLETEPVSDSRINLKFVRTEIKADSLFGRKLDLPTLGVDLPSAERLENILPKDGSGGGSVDLKSKLEDARSKAQALARKAKDKKKNLKKAVEERIKGGSAKSEADEGRADAAAATEPKDGAGGSAGTAVVDVEPVGEEAKEEGEEEEKEESGGDGKSDEKESPSSASLIRKPYFESTYCDEDLRVGRTGNGDMFVSVRA